MKKSTSPHIINVYRDKLVMCTPTSLEPLVFKFTPSMVSDLDVVNHEELNTNLKSFVERYKLKPVSLVIILASSVYFEKDYPGPSMPGAQDQEEFIDTIPFSATSSKLFRSGNGFKQIVINRDLYESLKKSFESLGYTVSAVVPGFALGPSEPQKEITAETCRVIYKKMDQITADSFISLSDSPSFQQKEQAFLKRHQTPLIVVSLLFLVTAAIVVPMTLRKPTLPPKKTPVPISRPSPTVVPTPTSAVATPSAELLAAFSVQILNGSGRAGEAASLSARLSSAGLTNIQTGNNPQVTDKTLVILSPQVATAAGEFITAAVQDLYPDLSATTNTEAEFDITVIIGKTTP